MSAGDPLLSVRGLSVEFTTPDGPLRAVDDVSFDIAAGETLGVIGESGCGKSTLMLSLVGLLDRPAGRVLAGSAWWKGLDLLTQPRSALQHVRGREIGLVFQDPQTALHPAMSVVGQVAEAFRAHRPDLSRAAAREAAGALLESVGIPGRPADDKALPHQWSGGMRQRALIAMALAHLPELLIADEPTTALDVTVQAQILDLLRGRGGASEQALLLITHDLGVVAELADRVAVMYAGRFVEVGPVAEVFDRARHPYTRNLLASRPGVAERSPERGADAPRLAGVPLLQAENLTTVYASNGTGPGVRAVDDVSLRIELGEVVAVAGESGCGKSSLARTLVGLERPRAGRVRLGGDDFINVATGITPTRGDRRRVQMVFQDPYASLNPRRAVADAVAQPLRIHDQFDARGGWSAVQGLLEQVGLTASHAARFPHQLSGGERQRVSIARAIALEPELLVLDEPLTALDVAVQARILAVLSRLRTELGLAMILIAHDLTVVREVADRVAVMYLGRIVEGAYTSDLFERPSHPYTRALLSAVPASHPRARRLSRRIEITGEVPDAADPPSGCSFHPRCWKVDEACRAVRPMLEATSPTRACACFHPES